VIADLFTLATYFITLGFGGLFGYSLGFLNERSKWDRLRKGAIAGQRLWIQSLGEVMVLGYSPDETLVDVIPTERMGEARWPDELEPETLDLYTISMPTKQFLTQVAPESVKSAARL
jgi:hypothetical protein